jgi:hypothetical protein
VTERLAREIAEIEQTQAALRDSIEVAKDLARQAEKLLQRHRNRLERARAQPANND